ncbi:IclR family transcriptional regulator [Variovorax sp. PCZ-1]|uniref:IclR family transcriptional regulator n=1 Tax=Variovorax sp. PCZ-1 TaxID=2835533 RepID=UPI001BD0B217|nr:IclR family transcriptional regulator [Variovorax sp. PCZ-1]MBS7806069.1 IclR family transcriptional regulator [Variovorax sp. PCZ-1]
MSDGIVKSAARALDVLEYFANRREPAGLTELADALGYPRSSTSVLLASLVKMGYLRQDAHTRQFMPTPRVALLGAWIETDTGVTETLYRLRELTGETVILAQRNGLDAQYIQVLESTADIRLILRMGTKRRLVRASTGHVLLAAMSDAEIHRILRKSNNEAPEVQQVPQRDLMHAINIVRAQGYCIAQSSYTLGGTVMAARLPTSPDSVPMAVGVGGPTERLLAAQDKVLRAFEAVGIKIARRC